MTTSPSWRGSLRPLHERNFRWYFFSRFVNTLGNMMASVALAFAVLDITDSATALGQVLAAHTIPMVLFLLWGGVIADRFSRVLIIQVSNVVSGVTQAAIALLVITGTADLPTVIALSAVHGLVSAMSYPAMNGLVPQLVPRDELQKANALLSLVRGGLTVIGPSVSALLVVTVGPGWALLVDGLTWLVAAGLLLGMRVPRREIERKARAGTLAELREGWDYFRRTTWLWLVVLAFCALNAIHSRRYQHAGPRDCQADDRRAGLGLGSVRGIRGPAADDGSVATSAARAPIAARNARDLARRSADDPARRLPSRLVGRRCDAARGRRGGSVQSRLDAGDAGERRREHVVARVFLRRTRIVRCDADRAARGGAARCCIRPRRRHGRRGHRLHRDLLCGAYVRFDPFSAAQGPGCRAGRAAARPASVGP